MKMITMAAAIYMLIWIILHVLTDSIMAARTEVIMILFIMMDFMAVAILPITQD